jgi:GTP pyrophosphokinase
MKDLTLAYKYEDEYKFVLDDKNQQNKIIEFITNNLSHGKACEEKNITQHDSYFDNERLTLHKLGITLRLRNYDNVFSLSLKKKISDEENKEIPIYHRMKEKEKITADEAGVLLKNGYINKRCLNLLSAIVPNHGKLTEKVKIKTNRKILYLTQHNQKVLETHFDEMTYSINGVRNNETFYEMEIETTDINEEAVNFIKDIQAKFNLIIWNKSKYDRGIFLYKRAQHSQASIEPHTIKNQFNISDDVYEQRIKIFNQHFDDKGLFALNQIYNEYLLLKPYIEKEKEKLLAGLKYFSSVHSIRSRVKDPYHLIEKILRKGHNYFENGQKLTALNFNEHITDLIGIRILHLYKNDWQIIDDQIIKFFKSNLPQEKIFYIRTGDDLLGLDREELTTKRHIEIIPKPSGYRSLHYLFKREVFLDTGNKINIYVEIQVRTVFEEAWSEIDHDIRYPYYENETVISDYLKTFNRIAGSADEMANFLKTNVKRLINKKS